MRGLIVLATRHGLHGLTRKFVAEVLVSSLASLLVMAVVANLKPAAPVIQDDRRPTSVEARPIAGETKESLDDFLERVALSHVAGPKTPGAGGEASLVAGDPATPAAATLPSRQAAAQKHDRPHSGKAPAAVAAKAPQPAQTPLQPIATAAAPPAASATDWLFPVKYGMGLAGNVQDMVSASSARVVESVASVGGALTAFGKKPQS